MTEALEDEIRDRLPTKKLIKRGSQCYEADEGKLLFLKRNKTLNARVMLDGELESLKQIDATKTIRVPKQHFVLHDYNQSHESVIVLEHLDLEKIELETAKSLGRDLADLHDYNNKLIRFNEKASGWIGGVMPSAKAVIRHRSDLTENIISDAKSNDDDNSDQNEEDDGIKCSKHQIRYVNDDTTEPSTRQNIGNIYSQKFVPEPNTEVVHEFGFNVPTSCGALPQINNWSTNWIEFFSRYRLDEPIKLILSEHGDRELIEKWSFLQLRVDKFFKDYDKEEHIIPSLLHGDLWSGNVGQLKGTITDDQSSETTRVTSEPVIYDPSSFYGHSEYEFGIARMFGGIPKTFEQSYFEVMPKKKLFEKRNKLYQLFHHLNHWNHFGFGYRNSSLKILNDLNDMIK